MKQPEDRLQDKATVPDQLTGEILGADDIISTAITGTTKPKRPANGRAL